jgi:hypothetical protein
LILLAALRKMVALRGMVVHAVTRFARYDLQITTYNRGPHSRPADRGGWDRKNPQKNALAKTKAFVRYSKLF